MTPIPRILSGIYAATPDGVTPRPGEQPDAAFDELEVTSALHAWMHAQVEADRARLSLLYHPQALSWDAGHELSKGRLTVQEQQVAVFGTTATGAGVLRWETAEGNTSISIPLRFSFTYVKSEGRWLIAAQHLSRMPAS